MFVKGLFATLVVLSCLALWAGRSAGVAGRVGQSRGRTSAEGGHKTIVPAELPGVPADSLSQLCRERAGWLRRQLGPACAAVTRPPFVLAGDFTEAELQGKFAETVPRVCDALVAGYFRRLPDRPVTILMFRTETAYRQAAEQLFFDRRVSRFAYYKPGRQTVLVNLAEGDGGLLHELTHVLMDADFPGAPRWLQEGLAALHEGCDVRTSGGKAASKASADEPCKDRVAQAPAAQLVPRHNWRWTVLQRAVAENRLPPLMDLITQSKFRGEGEALDYAFARYFCWFLQERGKLQPLYVTLRERAATDRTGAATLLELLGAQDWESVDRDFRAWLEAMAKLPS